MDLSIVSKHSSRNLATSTICWSCLGGVDIGIGILQTLTDYHSFRWVTWLLFGVASLAFGIFWAVMLLRRVTV
jgi:hypothetical protein